jgi:hypothetical protein
MDNSLPVGNFRNLFKDFLSDLESVFPELKENIKIVMNEETKLGDDEFVVDIMSTLENCKNYIEEEDDDFFENILENTLLHRLNISSIWKADTLSTNNKESIWKYLQTMLVVGSFIKNTSKNIANLIEKLNNPDADDEIGETIKKQANILGNVFSNIDQSKLEESTEGVKDMFSGDNVIMKLAEEMSSDIQSGKSGINPENIMQSMMSGDTSSMVNMIEHIGSQIQTKINSGELDQAQLINQAQSMAQTISSDPNISKFAQSMNGNGNMDFSNILGSVSKMMGGNNSGKSSNLNPLSTLLGGAVGNKDESEMPDLDELTKNAKTKVRKNKIIDRRRHKK